MAVVIRTVEDVLKPLGLNNPDLAVLQATHQSYRALLLQPAGPILADTARIGPLDIEAAVRRSDAFLSLATERGDQLIVTPEYYLPIASLLKCAQGATFPSYGALWVLGCESMTYDQLELFKKNCDGFCDVIFEDIAAPRVQGNYFDPVAYCFVTKDPNNRERKVILLQFKTAPSRDEHGFENKYLRCGQTIYQFKGTDGFLSLSTIICSDAFSIGADATAIQKLTDRALLIHIQLNPKPKHVDYRKYRAETFQKSQDMTNCDIICLNWAQNIIQYDAPDKVPSKWRNESGSAWYLPEHRCSTHDNEVIHNEKKGLYYTWLQTKKRHVLHFHYDEAVFALTSPKIAQNGFAIHNNHVGPLLDSRFCWDEAQQSWCEVVEIPDTGWRDSIAKEPHTQAAFQSMANEQNCINVERAISLSCGPKTIKEQWYFANKLDACRIDENEVSSRTTIQLDRDNQSEQIRHKRINTVATLNHVLNNESLPAQIKDLVGGGAYVNWTPDSPNTNVFKLGTAPALIAYLGEAPLPAQIRDMGEAAFELLRRENAAHRHRVAICYRTFEGTIKFADIKPLTDITYSGGSMTSITEGGRS